MSKEARQWAEALALPDPAMKSVLLQLAYMHRKGHTLFPSQKMLADKLGQSPRTVWEALKLLEAFGAIQRTARSTGAKGRTSDAIVLALTVIAPLSKDAIRLARRGLRKSRNARPAAPISQLAHGARPPRALSEGIGDEYKTLSHVGTELSKGQYTHETVVPTTGPALRMIVGGRQ